MIKNFETLRWAGITLLAGLALGQTGGTHSVAIFDPVLQMKAWTLTNVPNGWVAEGTMLPGSSCESATSPVVRAFSADGHTGSYQLPRVDWVWGAGTRPSNDCLPINGPISARDYLNRLVQIRELEFVREEPVPMLPKAKEQTEEINRQTAGRAHRTIDMARFLVRSSVNGTPTDEWLSGSISCYDRIMLGVGRQGGCAAFVNREFAPVGKLEAAAPIFASMNMVLNDAWMDAWKAAMVQRSNALSQRQTQALLAQGRLAQAQRNRQHQDFMSNMQSTRDARNAKFKDDQYRKTKNKEDYVDYILDCKRLASGSSRVSVGSNCPNRETGW